MDNDIRTIDDCLGDPELVVAVACCSGLPWPTRNVLYDALRDSEQGRLRLALSDVLRYAFVDFDDGGGLDFDTLYSLGTVGDNDGDTDSDSDAGGDGDGDSDSDDGSDGDGDGDGDSDGDNGRVPHASSLYSLGSGSMPSLASGSDSSSLRSSTSSLASEQDLAGFDLGPATLAGAGDGAGGTGPLLPLLMVRAADDGSSEHTFGAHGDPLTDMFNTDDPISVASATADDNGGAAGVDAASSPPSAAPCLTLVLQRIDASTYSLTTVSSGKADAVLVDAVDDVLRGDTRRVNLHHAMEALADAASTIAQDQLTDTFPFDARWDAETHELDKDFKFVSKITPGGATVAGAGDDDAASLLLVHSDDAQEPVVLVASVLRHQPVYFILDSAASFNVSAVSDNTDAMFASTSPSHVRARVANGATTSSSLTGTTIVHVAGESYPVPFECLQGCQDRIISVPFLTSLGFSACLAAEGSHLVSPHGAIIDVERSGPGPLAMWTVPMHFDGEHGHATVAAREAPAPLVASLVHVNAKTVGVGTDTNADCVDHGAAAVLVNAPASAPPAAEPDGTTRLPGRFPALTGAALHAALGHLTSEKFRAVRRRSTGLAKASVIPQHARTRCRGCMLGGLTRADIPRAAPYSTRGRYAKGERWGMDFSRTFPTSLWNHTGYVILVEDQTLFIKLYFINNHAEVWDKLREFVPWCKRTFGAVVKALKPDSDPVWTSGRALDPDTVEARAFSDEHAVVFERSAPYTQATAIAENVTRPLLALMNTQLVHASLSSKFWEPSCMNAQDVLNMLPKPGSQRPLLQRDVSPHEAMFGQMPDLSRLAGAFGSLCYVHVAKSKPSQLKDTSRAALYLGIAPGSSGWRVLLMNSMSVATSLHVTIDHDLRRRPAMILDSDNLRRDGAPGSVLEGIARERALFDGHSTSGIVVMDPISGRPERVVEIHDAYGSGENHLTTVVGTPSPNDTPGGAVLPPAPGPLDTPLPASVTPLPGADAADASSSGTASPTADALCPTAAAPVVTAPSAAAPGAAAPGAGRSLTSRSPATRRSRLPRSTRISVQQLNPKRGQSWARYEAYKHATTVGEYLDTPGVKTGDLTWDIDHGYVTVDPAAAMALLDPSISLLCMKGTGERCLHLDHATASGATVLSASAPRSYPTADLLSTSVATAVAARLAELGPPPDTPDHLDGLVALTVTAGTPLSPANATSREPDGPITPKALLSHPRRDAFVTSMVKEAKQLLDKYKTLRPVTKHVVYEALRADPDFVRIVPSMWVLCEKFHADGSFNRTKARLVACENNSKYTVPDTWSPTVALSSVRLILDIAAHYGAHLLELDVSGAYLLGKRSSRSRVFLRLPPNLDLVRSAWDDPRLRYTNDDGDTMLFAVDTNLYGCQDAGAIWFECFKEWITSDTMGFTQATGDACVFVRRNADGFIFVATYVDDTLAAFSSAALKSWFLANFESRFDHSADSGVGQSEFLGITIKSNADRTVHSLNTPRVFDRLQKRLDKLGVPDLIPSSPRAPLPPDAMDMIFAPVSDDNPLIPADLCNAPALLGVGGWVVMAVRPAEAFAAALLGRMVRRPTRSYVKALLHFLAYLMRTRDDELTVRGGAAAQFTTDVDSSWANCPGTQRSWFGFCMRTDGGAFMWRSKLAPSVALSSRDAEAIAAVFAVRAMLGLQILLHDLGFVTPDPLLLRVDNTATVQNTTTDLVHRDSRHMAIRLAFLREQVRRDLVCVEHVRSAHNLADVFTKILPAPDHDRIRRILMGMGGSGATP